EKFTECKEKLKKLWKKDIPTAEIARDLGVDKMTVWQWGKKLGLKKRTTLLTSVDGNRRSIIEVIHELLKTNYGAVSARDIVKKIKNASGKSNYYSSPPSEQTILKHVKESGKFETMMLPPWLKMKLNPEDLPSGFVNEWRYTVDALANRNVAESFSALANMQNDYPKYRDLIDFSGDGRIVFLQGEYDCLVLKIAKITSLHKVSTGHVRDSLLDANLFDNSYGGAQSAMQITLSKWDVLLKNFNEKNLKKIENEIEAKISNNRLPTSLHDKLDGESDPSTGSGNVKVDKEFSNLCSKICLEPLKEFAPKVEQFHVLSSSDTSKLGYAGMQIEAVVNNETVTIQFCLSDTRPELLLEWAGAKAKNKSSKTQSPRDSLRQTLICQRCYTDSDISFLCPHIMYIFWHFWEEDKPPFNRREISLLLNDLWFFFKCWNPLEDILYDTILSASTDDKLSYLSALKQMITSNNRGFKRLSATYYEELASDIHAEHNQTFEFSKARDIQRRENIKSTKKLFLEIWKHNKEMWDEILNLEQRKKMLLLSYVHVEASNH
ncbi:hypothetical protein CMO96_01565, partial [Candidatus Woesebacteria bacterium]|nr:hypothetical protein [Candidatus Woesebacteria bacterium]